MESDILKDNEKKDFLRITDEKGDMPEVIATLAIYNLANYLSRYYGKKVIILLLNYYYFVNIFFNNFMINNGVRIFLKFYLILLHYS